MATLTAQILIGFSHMYNGGINPTHAMYLSENSRPAWILITQNVSDPVSNEKVVWIPTLENMLEDGLLMVALYVLQDKNVCAEAKRMFNWSNDTYIEAYNIKDMDRQHLYTLCKNLEYRFKVILSVFKGSGISQQLQVLLEYGMEVEVCESGYNRNYNVWTESMETSGEFNERMGG